MNEIVKPGDQQVRVWDERPAPAINETAAIISMIERAARDPAVDLDKLDRLMKMRERVEERNAKLAYDDAFATMQGKLPVIDERGKNTSTHKTYAKFDDINEAIKPVLSGHGFSLRFRIKQDGQKIAITGVLSHRGGYSEETTIELPIDTTGQKNAVQAIGSSQSYGQRYTARALLSLSSRNSEDDDGKGAGGAASITDDQFETIRKLMVEAGANEIAFLKFFKLDDVATLPAARFAEAVEMLNRKARKQ